jgi:hypothetical protein
MKKQTARTATTSSSAELWPSFFSLFYPPYILATNNCKTHFEELGVDADNIKTDLLNDLLNSVMHLRASRKAEIHRLSEQL